MKAGKGKRPEKRTKAPVVALEVTAAPVEAMPRAQVVRRAAWCGFSALLLVFYFWTATSSNRPFHARDTSHDLYGQLTAAFQKGQLYLDTKPAPQLLAMNDPYEPAANQPFRLLDASLYRGRYYVYFGAAPVVVLYLPWRVLTGSPLSNDVAVTLFCFGGYIFCCLLLFLLLDSCEVKPTWWLQAAAVLAIGVGQFAPIVLRRPKMYEVAVSAAYCFLSGALYFGARRILKAGERPWTAVVAALLLGLAVGSRPHCALAAVVLAGGYALYLWRARGLRGRAWFGEYAPFLAPLAAVGLTIAWYNFARFGNPLEFGVKYMVGVLDFYHSTPLSLRLRQMLASFYYLVLCLPNFKTRFPFVELSGGAEPFGNPDLYPNPYFHEPVGGLLAMAPLSIAGFALGFVRHRFDGPLRWVLGGLAACSLAMFAGLCSVPSASGRYVLDFAPALLTAGMFLCLSAGKRAVQVAAVAACLWSSAVNLGASVDSYGYPLERAPNTAFRSLASFFGGGPEAFTETIDGLHWEATVTFPHARPDSRETLLASGIYEAWDLLFVQYVKGDKAMFTWVHCGVSDKWGPWVPLKPGTPRRLTADYSEKAKRVTVKLDGEVVMDFAGTFYPSARDAVTVGTMKVGRFGLRDFSGQLETRELSFVPAR